MLAEMSGDEWLGWKEFAELEPFGPTREDLRSGYLASLLYNANRGKGQKVLLPGDFFATLKQQPRAQSPEEMKLALMAWTAVLGGKIVMPGEVSGG